MSFIKQNISAILMTVFIIVAVSIFYTPMYAYQEGLQIFMANSEFFADTCLHPGGFSDYIGNFLVQFFMYPAYLVGILVLIIVGTQLITKQIFKQYCKTSTADALAVVSGAAMMMAATEFNVMFGGCVAIFLAIAASAVTIKTDNKIVLCALTPVVYFITGGWCTLIYISAVAIKFTIRQGLITVGINLAILVFTSLIIKKITNTFSVFDTFTGVQFNRYPDYSCATWYIAVALIVICILLAKLLSDIKSKLTTVIIYAATLALPVIMVVKYDSGAMLDFSLDKMVRYKQWTKIIDTVKGKRYSTDLSLCYLNLALNELGIMDAKMFNFVQLGTNGLASSVIDAQDKSIVNSEIYFRLGLMNIAERLSIEAMESINTFQKSARMYKRLAEIAIIKNNKPLAIRYLKKLKDTLFYKAWANRAEEYINNPDKVEPLSDWKIEPLAFNNDFFFSEKYEDELFLHLLANNPHNIKVFNYYTGYLMLSKDIGKLYNFLSNYRTEDELGIHVYEAILLYLSQYKSDEFKRVMAEQNDLTTRFQNFNNFMHSNNHDQNMAYQLFGNTYWYYYLSNMDKKY